MTKFNKITSFGSEVENCMCGAGRCPSNKVRVWCAGRQPVRCQQQVFFPKHSGQLADMELNSY